jgi:hypothetical protein
MIAPQGKLDVALEGLEDHQAALASIRTGSHVRVERQADGRLACCLPESSSGVVGYVPQAVVTTSALVRTPGTTGSVRSVRRQPLDDKVVYVLVRITAGGQQAAQRPPPPPTEDEEAAAEEEGMARLSVDQLDAIGK